jgi:hypothetical protein
MVTNPAPYICHYPVPIVEESKEMCNILKSQGQVRITSKECNRDADHGGMSHWAGTVVCCAGNRNRRRSVLSAEARRGYNNEQRRQAQMLLNNTFIESEAGD